MYELQLNIGNFRLYNYFKTSQESRKYFIRVCFVEFKVLYFNVPPWVNIFANCGLIKRFTNNYWSLVHCFSKFRSHYLPFFSKTGTVNKNFITVSE